MSLVFTDENNIYGLDCSNAVWATDRVHAQYHKAGLHVLSDADFIIETDNKIIILEYKNSSIPNAVNPSAFNPLDDKPLNSVIRKFYDTLHYLTLLQKDGPKHYIYIVETPHSDAVMRARLRERLTKGLPFQLQADMNTGVKLIDEVGVFSISEWNNDPEYGAFPFVKLP